MGLYRDNGIEIYSTYNQGKPLLAERCIRNLKKEIYMHLI